jgi:hypothetical protein
MSSVESVVSAGRSSAAKRASMVKQDNVIILTGGLTGSSVLAGVLGAAGYWFGEDTFKKRDYNTYENSELIRLNRQLMARVAAGEGYTTRFMPEAIRQIEGLIGLEDPAEYETLVAACESRSPWLWKDPRLWMTIRFWQPLLPWDRIKVLLLRRDPVQAWISCTQRRQVQTYEYACRYNESIQSSLREFLESRSIRYLPVLFEDLVVRPEAEISRLAEFLGAPLTMEHLHSTYDGVLYRKPKSVRDGIEATLIYLKNYRERLR